MKKIIALLVCFIITHQAVWAVSLPAPDNDGNSKFSDTTPKYLNHHADLLARSRRQKTWAFVLLGLGGVAGTISAATAYNNSVDNALEVFFDSPHFRSKKNTYNFFMGLSIAAFAGSGLLFLRSGKNRKKAWLHPGSNRLSNGIPGKISSEVLGVTLTIPLVKK